MDPEKLRLSMIFQEEQPYKFAKQIRQVLMESRTTLQSQGNTHFAFFTGIIIIQKTSSV